MSLPELCIFAAHLPLVMMVRAVPVQGSSFLPCQPFPQRLILNQGQVCYGNYSFKACTEYHIEASAAVNAKVTVTLWAFGNLQIDLEVTVAQEADGVNSVTNASLSNTFAALISPSSSLLYSVPTRRAYITISDWCCPCGCSCLMKALYLYINSLLEWNIFQIPHSSSGRDLWLVHLRSERALSATHRLCRIKMIHEAKNRTEETI